MSKKHFFLYDFLLPIAGILALGNFFSDHFDTVIFQGLDGIKAFGIGAWFGHSPLRGILWNYSWLFFSAVPALAWLVWVRINMEYDWVNGRKRLDRPIFSFFHGIGRWIEGGGEVRMLRLAYERRLAIADDRVRRLEKELETAQAGFDDDSEDEWQNGYLPPAQQG